MTKNSHPLIVNRISVRTISSKTIRKPIFTSCYLHLTPGFCNKKPHLYTKGGEKQYKDYEKNFPCLIIS